MNYTLFKTSIICSVILFYFIIKSNSCPLLKINIISGCLSSVLNHGTTNHLNKWLDRIIMFYNVLIDIYLTVNSEYWICLILYCGCVGFYLMSKYYNRIWYHIICHFIVTYCNIYLIQNITIC